MAVHPQAIEAHDIPSDAARTPAGATAPPARAVAQFWDWVPAFRAVAEAEHLPTAGERLGLTASALSRSVRALEEALETPLFDRVGRRLALNAQGALMLTAVRDAMRLVHEGMLAVQGNRWQGPVRLVASSVWGPSLVLPALQQLRTAHPGLVPHWQSTPAGPVDAALRQGQIDVALVQAAAVDPALHAVPLGCFAQGLFAGPHHPLVEAALAPVESDAWWHRVQPWPFVQLDDGDHCAVTDWPSAWPRQIACVVDHAQQVIDALHAAPWLALLPCSYAASRGLVELPAPPLPARPVCALRRRPLAIESRADVLTQALHVVSRAKATTPAP